MEPIVVWSGEDDESLNQVRTSPSKLEMVAGSWKSRSKFGLLQRVLLAAGLLVGMCVIVVVTPGVSTTATIIVLVLVGSLAALTLCYLCTTAYMFSWIYENGIPITPPPDATQIEAALPVGSPGRRICDDLMNSALECALFRWFPKLMSRLSWTKLLDHPQSPVTKHTIRLPIGCSLNVWLKREDLNCLKYGGVKVRTLEFLLANARMHYDMQKQKSDDHNVDHSRRPCAAYVVGAPGTNQGAATFSHASSLAIKPGGILCVPQATSVCNSLSLITMLSVAGGDPRVLFSSSFPTLGFIRMLTNFFRLKRHRENYFEYCGGASPLGCLGHVSAALELVEQIISGEVPQPTHIFLAFGSGCTTAGIIVGLILARLALNDCTATGNNNFPKCSERRLLFLSSDVDVHSILIHADFPIWYAKRWLRKLVIDTADLILDEGHEDWRQGFQIELDRFLLHRVQLKSRAYPGYGAPSSDGEQAFAYFAAANPPYTGLDPTYAAKAAAEMLDVVGRLTWQGKSVMPILWASKTSNHGVTEDDVAQVLSRTVLDTGAMKWLHRGIAERDAVAWAGGFPADTAACNSS